MFRDKWLNLSRRFSNQTGATTVEYVLVAALLVVVIAATVILLEEKGSQIFKSMSDQIGDFSTIPNS